MAVTEAKAKFEAAKAAVADCMAKKIRLEDRLGELQSKLSEISILDIKKERQKAVAAVALSAISDGEYKKVIDKFGKVELAHSTLTEQSEAVKDAISANGDLLFELQQKMNEANRCLYLAIAETLEAEIKSKIPFRSLQMLAFARLRAGKVQGRDAWQNMLLDVCGAGRFTDDDLRETGAEVKKTYGI